MGDKASDLVQGDSGMLVLKTLGAGPMHGYGITLRIEQMSEGVFRVNAGSLFPALAGWNRAGKHQRRSGGRPRTSSREVLPAYGKRGRAALKSENRGGDGRLWRSTESWKRSGGRDEGLRSSHGWVEGVV